MTLGPLLCHGLGRLGRWRALPATTGRNRLPLMLGTSSGSSDSTDRMALATTADLVTPVFGHIGGANGREPLPVRHFPLAGNFSAQKQSASAALILFQLSRWNSSVAGRWVNDVLHLTWRHVACKVTGAQRRQHYETRHSENERTLDRHHFPSAFVNARKLTWSTAFRRGLLGHFLE